MREKLGNPSCLFKSQLHVLYSALVDAVGSSRVVMLFKLRETCKK